MPTLCDMKTATRVPEPDPYADSWWLLESLKAARRRDPVDALRDAEHLAALLRQDWHDLTGG